MDGRATVRPHPLVAVAVGGALGGWARLALAGALPAGDGGWPWGTFVANVSGAAVLALVVTRLTERLPPTTHLRPLIGTGFCGALTTFSTLQVEVIDLWRDGHATLGAAYYAASVAAALLAVRAGTVVARGTRAAW